METGSVDQSGSYVFEVTPTRQVESASESRAEFPSRLEESVQQVSACFVVDT
jgi:hypothetical protein